MEACKEEAFVDVESAEESKGEDCCCERIVGVVGEENDAKDILLS